MSKHGVHKIEDIAHLSKADLHIHSKYSDGRPTVAEILDYVENKTDLDAIAITDHDTMDGYFEAKKLMAEKEYRFCLIPGEEVTSKEGHILALFIKEPIEGGMPAHKVLINIKSQDGIAIAAHPFQHVRVRNPEMPMMDGVGLMTLIKEKKNFNGIEIVNATPTLTNENVRAGFVNRTMLLRAETGSSDAHIVEAIGKGYTLFEGKTRNELKRALFNHQTQAMHDEWTFFALFKYFFFFLPKGFRMALFTIINGRSRKITDDIEIPKEYTQ